MKRQTYLEAENSQPGQKNEVAAEAGKDVALAVGDFDLWHGDFIEHQNFISKSTVQKNTALS